jgi:hypothetical protein
MPESISASAAGVFLSTVSRMGGGRTIVKLEDALREATRAARESGGKAKINFEITISPAGVGVGDEPLFKVTGKVKRTLPEKPEAASNFFVDDDDNLTPRNPKQVEMKLSAMEGGAPKITSADLKQPSVAVQ